MRAVILRSFGDPDVLEIADVPTPEPATGQVRIAVTAATVNPADLNTRAGMYRNILPAQPEYGLGWDVAGTVDALGDGVTDFAVGDHVIGMSDYFTSLVGTQAEYVVLNASAVATAPAGISAVEAATLPLNSLTAAQALALIGPVESIAITGAGGAVGGFAAELAVRAGVTVYAVAGEQDADFVQQIGAIFVPRSADLTGSIRAVVPDGVASVFDPALVGAPALGAVRDGGVFVNAARRLAPPPERGIRVDSIMVHSDGTQLAELAARNLTVRLAGTLPLADVAEAHATLAKGGVRGRLVLVP